MEIKYAIVSSDDNPMYYDFWPIVRDLWIKIGIKPIFAHITEGEESVTEYGNYIIHKINPINGVNTGLQSQIIRMFLTKVYQDSVCITSDIDMLPLSKEYFTTITKDYNDNDMVILSADAYPNKVRYPICYNVGKGSTFGEILDFDCTFEEYVRRLVNFNWGWDTDELYFGKMVNAFDNQERIIKLNRGWSSGVANNRIDRVRWSYNPHKMGEYIDSHSLRPYLNNKDKIEQLISAIKK